MAVSGEAEFEYEPAGDPGSQGDPAGAAPAGDPNAQPQRQPPAAGEDPAQAGGAGDGSGRQQPPKGFVPAYRLREVSDRYNRLEGAYRTLAAQVDEMRRGAPAGGPRPAEPPAQSAEDRQILDQLFKVAPFLKIVADNPDALKQLIENAGVLPQMQHATEHQWTMHGRAFLDDLRGQVREYYGSDQINPRVLRQLEVGFIDWIENDPEARQRYIAGDRTLVQEFWKEATTHMYDPIRRRAQAEIQRRGERIARVPSSAPGSQALGKGGPPKPKTEEEVHDRAWDALEAARQ